MNTLLIYDSQFGNTELVARSLVTALSEFGEARAVRVGQIRPDELSGVDLLICGSPTQGMHASPAMQAFLRELPRTALNGLAVACFDTRFRDPQWLWKHSAAPSMARRLLALDAVLLVPPESFFVENMKQEGPLLAGEVERAATWALRVHEQYEVHRAQLIAR